MRHPAWHLLGALGWRGGQLNTGRPVAALLCGVGQRDSFLLPSPRRRLSHPECELPGGGGLRLQPPWRGGWRELGPGAAWRAERAAVAQAKTGQCLAPAEGALGERSPCTEAEAIRSPGPLARPGWDARWASLGEMPKELSRALGCGGRKGAAQLSPGQAVCGDTAPGWALGEFLGMVPGRERSSCAARRGAGCPHRAGASASRLLSCHLRLPSQRTGHQQRPAPASQASPS